MLNVTYMPFMLSVAMLSVIMQNVVAPKPRGRPHMLSQAKRQSPKNNLAFSNQGTLTERERFSTIDLLIKIGCFVKKEIHSFS